MYKNIILVIEEEENIKKLSSFARAVSDETGSHETMVLFNADIKLIEKYSSYADLIINIKTKDKELTSINKINYLHDILNETDFSCICFSQSIKALEIGGFLAGSFNTGILTDVEGFKEGKIFSRSMFQGKLKAYFTPVNKRNVFIVSDEFPVLKKEGAGKNKKAKIIEKEYEQDRDQIKLLEKSLREGESSMDDASVILSAGRGVGSSESLDKLFKISEKIPGSAVACSRPMVDLKIVEYPRQVGITGKTVSPEVYIAFGISGSSQHIHGMKGSEMIISINKDKNAAIFNHSDICIEDDIHGFIDEFLKAMSRN